MHFLKESFGQPLSFQSVVFQAKAAKLRVAAHHFLWRDSKRGSEIFPHLLPIARMHSNIRSLLGVRCNYPDRAILWRNWYRNSYIFNLADNRRELESDGIEFHAIIRQLQGEDEWNEDVRDRVKGQLQRTILAAIKHRALPDPQVRLRDKIMRWYKVANNYHPQSLPSYSLAGPPHNVAARIDRCLKRLSSLVAPRVCGAVFKVLWNGWVTERRFQNRGPSSQCVLGCIDEGRIGAEDAIEHYSLCPSVHRVWNGKLRTYPYFA